MLSQRAESTHCMERVRHRYAYIPIPNHVIMPATAVILANLGCAIRERVTQTCEQRPDGIPAKHLARARSNAHERQRAEQRAKDEGHVREAATGHALEDAGRIVRKSKAICAVGSQLPTCNSDTTGRRTKSTRASVEVAGGRRPRGREKTGIDDLGGSSSVRA